MKPPKLILPSDPSTGRPSGHQQTASGPEASSIPAQPVPPAPARLPPASHRSAGLPARPAALSTGPAPPPTAAPPPAAAAQRSAAAATTAAAAAVAVHAAAPPAEPTQHTQPAHAAALWNGRSLGQMRGDKIVQISRLHGLDKDRCICSTYNTLTCAVQLT